jgi:hypothetical protein
MSPYRRSADIAGTSHTGQLHGLDAPTLDPSTDTYVLCAAKDETSVEFMRPLLNSWAERSVVILAEKLIMTNLASEAMNARCCDYV